MAEEIKEEKKEIVKKEEVQLPANNKNIYLNADTFDHAQRVAMSLSKSKLVPKEYQGNVSDCLIALDFSFRTGASPLMVMQNMYIVYGKPSWASQYLIAGVNSCGRFEALNYEKEGEGDDRSCYAWAIVRATGKRVEGPKVSIKMAKAEGWYQKNGSKWQTIPELMLMYRSATFFTRLYAPEITMGLHTQDEMVDIGPKVINVTPETSVDIKTVMEDMSVSDEPDKKEEKKVEETPVDEKKETVKDEKKPKNPASELREKMNSGDGEQQTLT